MKPGDILRGDNGHTFVITGGPIAVQGREDCMDVRCTRRDRRCIGWHCPHCGAPCSSQGHDCPEADPTDKAVAPASTRDDGDTHEEQDST